MCDSLLWRNRSIKSRIMEKLIAFEKDTSWRETSRGTWRMKKRRTILGCKKPVWTTGSWGFAARPASKAVSRKAAEASMQKETLCRFVDAWTSLILLGKEEEAMMKAGWLRPPCSLPSKVTLEELFLWRGAGRVKVELVFPRREVNLCFYDAV